MAGNVDFDWFSVRRTHLNDIPYIYKIDSTSLVSNFSIDSLLERVVLYNDLCFVATENSTGNVIGYIIGSGERHYTKHFPGYTYISRFAVKDAYRRRGVGMTLLVIMENNLLMSGRSMGVVADVRKSNMASRAFFEKHEYSVSPHLSKPNAYERGDTPDDRFKIVIYKQFPSFRYYSPP